MLRHIIGNGVVLYKEGRFWKLDVHPEVGKRKRFSLRTPDERRARQIAQQYADDITRGRWNVSVGTIALVTALARYALGRWRKLRNKATMEIILRIFRYFADWCHGREIGTLDRVRPEHIESYLEWRRSQSAERYDKSYLRGKRRKKPVTNWTVNRDLAWIRAFFRKMVERGYTRSNPALSVEFRPVDQRVKHTLDADEIIKLLKSLSERMQELVLFYLNVGLRMNEVLTLRTQDVDLKRKVLLAQARKTHFTQEVPLNDEALQIAQRRVLQAGTSKLLFPSAADTQIDGHNLYRALRQASEKLGIRRCSAQVLRRTFGTLQASHLPQLALQKLMNHRSPATTAKFYVRTSMVPPVNFSSIRQAGD